MTEIHIKLILREDTDPKDIARFEEIFQVLIDKGALTGIKGGSTIIHFDGEANFQGIEFSYWPWRRRK